MVRKVLSAGARYCAVGLLVVGISSCGSSGGGGGGGGTPGEIAAALGYESAEGTPDAPLAIGDLSASSVVLYEGTVATGGTETSNSYYLVQGATPGVDYTVTLTNLTDDADVLVYQGDPTYTTTPADRAETGNATEAFTLAADQDVTALFVVVEGGKTAKGAKYTLSITPKPKSEGELSAPVDLYEIPVTRQGSTVGNDPDCCKVGQSQTGDTSGTPDSYYKVAVPANASVLVSLASLTADVDLYVSDDPNFATYDCFSAREGAVPEACEFTAPATPATTTLYIAVDGHYALEGAAYTIYVTPKPYGAGKAVLPCSLGAAPGIWDQSNTGSLVDDDGCGHGFPDPAILFPMSVLAGGEPGVTNKSQSTAIVGSNSYYLITGLTPKGKYRLTLEEATDLVDLYVYNKDNTFSTPICKPPYEDVKVQACNFTASGNDVYVAVDGYYSLSGAVYKLTLFPELIPQGSASAPVALNPVANSEEQDPWAPGITNTFAKLTVGPDAILGIGEQVSASSASAPRPLADVPEGTNGDSYYAIPVTQGAQYRVSLISMSADVNLYVYNDSTYTTPACTSFNGGLSDDKCYVNATGNALYVAVDGYFAKTGAAFKLQLREQDLTDDGSATGALKMGGAPLKYAGKVIGGGASGISTGSSSPDSYYFFYASPGLAYRITVTDMKDDVDLYVYQSSSTDPLSIVGRTPVCSSVLAKDQDESCVVNSTSYKVLLVAIDGSKAGANATIPFTIIAEETKPESAGGIQDLGSTLPITLKSLVDPGDKEKGIGTPGKSLDSFYSVTFTTGGVYRISIIKQTADATLYLSKDETFTSLLTTASCPNTLQKGGADEWCDLELKTGLTAYFAVDGAYTYGEGAYYYVVIQKLK